MYSKRILVSSVILLSFISVISGVEAQAADDIQPISNVNMSTTTSITDVETGKTFNSFSGLESDAVNLDSVTTSKGYEATLFNKDAVLYLTPGLFTGDLQVSANRYKGADVLPWKLKLISGIYEFNLPNNDKPFNLQLKYSGPNKFFKQVYYFDEQSSEWKALPTTDYPNENFVRTLIKSSYRKLAVFANPDILTVGKASWYSFKPGLLCASPDFAKGSKLRVTNLDNGKFIEVEVNDWGPERTKHPDRVVDLSKEAFKALAPLSQGTIKIAIDPIEIKPDRQGRVLGVKETGLTDKPKLSAASAIIINEANGQVVYSKNSQKVAPLASLTKIVAVSVFLKQKPNLADKIKYSNDDAAKNNLYAPAYESAKIAFKDGDVITKKDAVYGSLVASANNAVETMVRNSGLPRSKFIDEMNKLAESWGAKNTHFIEPTGLSTYNVSTVEDYAIITREAFRNKTILDASTIPKYTIKIQNRKTEKKLTNTNRLIVEQAQENLKMDSLGINGSKTGYLREAGYCLMTRFKSVNGQFVIVTFGASSRANSFSEMMDLIKYANLKS